jgi:hypothetical protein
MRQLLAIDKLPAGKADRTRPSPGFLSWLFRYEALDSALASPAPAGNGDSRFGLRWLLANESLPSAHVTDTPGSSSSGLMRQLLAIDKLPAGKADHTRPSPSYLGWLMKPEQLNQASHPTQETRGRGSFLGWLLRFERLPRADR